MFLFIGFLSVISNTIQIDFGKVSHSVKDVNIDLPLAYNSTDSYIALINPYTANANSSEGRIWWYVLRNSNVQIKTHILGSSDYKIGKDIAFIAIGY